jgi:mRNA-degrading endonuclease toxin of MazEF toxin-antitoxin module
VKQWDTSQWTFPHGTHPCVIVSRTARCQNPAFETVNVLACQSQRATRPASDLEALLDVEDGMDWQTLVRCDFLWVAPKSELRQQRGSVSAERRRTIGTTIIRTLGLWLP